MWWRHFDTPQLNTIVEDALSNNFSIKAAMERFEELAAAARKTEATLLPGVKLNGDNALQQKKGEDSSKKFSLGLAASYEIDLWGRLRAMRQAAEADLLGSREALNITALSVAAETATTWLSYIENTLQMGLVQKQQELNRKKEAIIDLKVRTGQSEIADLLQQRQLVQQDESTLAVLAARKIRLAHRLNILRGRPPQHTDIDSLTIKDLPKLPPLPATGVPLSLLQRRPDVYQAWLALTAADHRTAAAVASRLPALSLRGNIETNGTSSSQLFSNWVSTFAANLLAPIFDGGSRKAEVRRREAVARQRYNIWAETMLTALQEVEDALIEEHALLQQLDSGKRQLQLARDTVHTLNRRYRQGATNYQRVLQATLSAQRLERSLLTIRLQLLIERIALYRALSGGLPNTLFQPTPHNGQ